MKRLIRSVKRLKDVRKNSKSSARLRNVRLESLLRKLLSVKKLLKSARKRRQLKKLRLFRPLQVKRL